MVIKLTENPPQNIIIIILIEALFVRRMKKNNFHIVYLYIQLIL